VMQETGPLTIASGALVADSQNGEQVGVGGTPPLRDRVPPAGLAGFRRENLAPTCHGSTWAAATPVPRSARRARGRTGLIRRRATQAVYAAGYAALRRAA